MTCLLSKYQNLYENSLSQFIKILFGQNIRNLMNNENNEIMKNSAMPDKIPQKMQIDKKKRVDVIFLIQHLKAFSDTTTI